MDETKAVIKSLYKAFIDNDASMIEINPYAEDTYGKSKCFCDHLLLLTRHVTRIIKRKPK